MITQIAVPVCLENEFKYWHEKYSIIIEFLILCILQ